jgi:uncharacterized protein (TIGR03083 family)
VTYEELIELLRQEGESLGALPLSDVDVPTCPDWTLPDLVVHVGTVHRWQEAQLRAPDPERLIRVARPPRPDLDELPDWFHTGLESLIAVLADTDPERLTPSWFGPRPAAFWARRAANETAIHRWDAEAAITAPSPLDARQAVDVIDELFEVIAIGRFDPATWEGETVTIHLHATDIDGEWLIAMGSDGLDVSHTHAKGDVAARGSASDLALMMTGRVPAARLEVFGEGRHFDRWFQSVRF